jgi:hypothetical protein
VEATGCLGRLAVVVDPALAVAGCLGQTEHCLGSHVVDHEVDREAVQNRLAAGRKAAHMLHHTEEPSRCFDRNL